MGIPRILCGTLQALKNGTSENAAGFSAGFSGCGLSREILWDCLEFSMHARFLGTVSPCPDSQGLRHSVEANTPSLVNIREGHTEDGG